MFVIIDGIDGSGKSTIIQAWSEQLQNQGKEIVSLKDYWNTNNEHPTLAEVEHADVIISAEPTTVWVGAGIRKEIISNSTDYSALSTANAYSLDRLMLYKRLLIPLLEKGKTIIQDRGVTTSLCYQPIQDSSLSRSIIKELEGNRLALEHSPDHLVIADLSPEVAMQRLGSRHDKNDNAQFEQKSFLEEARKTFLEEEYQNIFTERGTKIHTLNTGASIDIMKQEAIKLFNTITK